jgi:enoyl-CoA hydratase
MINKNLITHAPENGVQIIKISRPSALNALNTQTLEELKLALGEAAIDSAVRVVILTGDGEKAFIAGADISEMKDFSVSEATRFSQLGHEVTKLLELMAKPTIAAVNGYALGGGTEMALACDFILASNKAVFGLPEVSLGVMPGFGGTLRLARSVGWPKAKELIFSGRKVRADEALEMGLVNHVYPPELLLQESMKLAQTIASQSRTAIAKSKSLMNEFTESVGLNNKLDVEAQGFGYLFSTPDQREGMAAFLEKRSPKFEG